MIFLGKNTEKKHITFESPIEKEVTRTDTNGADNSINLNKSILIITIYW